MSLLALAAVAAVPVYILALAALWALIRPRRIDDWALYLLTALALTAWLAVVLALASGIDEAAGGVDPALRALEEIRGGAR